MKHIVFNKAGASFNDIPWGNPELQSIFTENRYYLENLTNI